VYFSGLISYFQKINLKNDLFIVGYCAVILSKLRGRRSVRFGIVKVYVEKECRKIKKNIICRASPKKETNP
jgi:hypothetical protein